MSAQKSEPRILRKMIVHDNGRKLKYIFPAVGPNNYQIVGKAIISQGLSVAHGDYAAPLIHAAYCSDVKDEPEFTNVRELARKNWLWVFNRNLWTSKGVYTIQDERAVGRSELPTITELEAMLKGGRELKTGGIRFSKDNRVRFAPKGSYVLGDHTTNSLAKDGFMITQYGEHGANLMAESAATLRNNQKIDGLDITRGQNPELRVSVFVECDGILRFGGGHFEDNDGGSFAFPVSAPREAYT